MGESSNEEFLTMGDAARRLGLTKARISQLAASGSLAASMVGGRKMVSAASVLTYDTSRRSPGRRGRLETASIYTLMSAEYEVARVAYDPQFEYPFEVDPLRQLGLVDRISWFDERALTGFVDDAVELLAGSEHASADGRLSYIAEGIERRRREVTGALRVLSARL